MASRPPAEVGSARMLRQAAAADSSDPRRAGRALWKRAGELCKEPSGTAAGRSKRLRVAPNGVRDAPARAFGAPRRRTAPPLLCRTVDQMQSRVCTHDAGHLANGQRDGGLLKWLLHLAWAEFAEVAARLE